MSLFFSSQKHTKRMAAWLAVLITAVMVVGVVFPLGTTLFASKPHLRGAIADMSADGATLTLSLQGGATQGIPYSSGTVTVTAKTKVYSGDTGKALAMTQIYPGMVADVYFSGSPSVSGKAAVGTAKKIVIYSVQTT